MRGSHTLLLCLGATDTWRWCTHGPITCSPHGPCEGEGHTRPCFVCSRVAWRARLGSLGGPAVRQALERPPMPAHARRGHPIKAGARAGHEPRGAVLRHTVRHVRVTAPVIDARVPLPARIGPRPRLEGLLDHRTLLGCQVPGGLPLPRTIGRLLGGCGGIVRAYRHPLPAAPGGFPLHTRGIEAWSSQLDSLRPDSAVTIWDVISLQGFGRDCH